jgi:hypothetical protein
MESESSHFDLGFPITGNRISVLRSMDIKECNWEAAVMPNGVGVGDYGVIFAVIPVQPPPS